MRIKLTKKKGSVSLRITAESDEEGIDLKDVVMAAGAVKDAQTATGLANLLGKRGYKGGLTKETRNTKEFRVNRDERA